MKRHSPTLLLAAAMGLVAMSIQARPEEATPFFLSKTTINEAGNGPI